MKMMHIAVNRKANEAERLTAWRAGDRRAGSRLIQHYYAEIARFFVMRVGRDAEDLTQETFVSFVTGLKSLRGTNLRAFLHGIARNKLLDYLRRTRRASHRRSEVDPDDLATFDPAPAAKVDSMLLAKLRRLPCRDRILVDLYYWQGWSYRALADQYATSEAVIRGRLHRARARLALLLDAEDLDRGRVTLAHWACGAGGRPDR